MNNFFDNQRILRLIWRRRFHFVVIGAVAILLSAIFSGPAFIKPKFRSTARIYPINLEILSEESETEQMLEVVNSRDIKLKMFDAFDLDHVYKIDREHPLYMTYMLDIYNRNVSTGKTTFETVEIKVKDHNPHRACNMVDSIIHFYNQKVREMHRIKEMEMVRISRKLLDRKYATMDSLLSQLDTLRNETGILDYSVQAEEVTKGYMNALTNGRASGAATQKIEQFYDRLASKGSEAQWLASRFNYLTTSIDSVATQLEFYQAEYEKEITYAHVVEEPIPADKKSYPIRWLIVVLSVFSALLTGLLVFLVIDYRKED